MTKATISAIVSNIQLGDYVARISISKATATGPVEILTKDIPFNVPGVPTPDASLDDSVSVDTNA